MSETPADDVLSRLAAIAGVDPSVLERPETARYLQDIAEALARLPDRTGEPPLVPFDPAWPEEPE